MVSEVKTMADPLFDCSPLISAAASGKLRLVRLLVEGGAQVNGRNPKGETALLAACKALRGAPDRPDTVKLLTYLLQNKANPNAQDCAGRTPLMYACMARAGARVASALLAAGADPSMEDHTGASALVYAINAQHQATVEVLMDACRARGRDIIVIATEAGINRGPETRRYLSVPLSPDSSPASCMSPSDIVLKTGSPNPPEGENIFNFRGTGQRGSSSSSCELGPPLRQRMLSEPWLAIHNLARLSRAYEQGVRERSLQEADAEDSRWEGAETEDEESHLHRSMMDGRRESVVKRVEYRHSYKGPLPRVSQSLLSLTEVSSSQAGLNRPVSETCPGGSVMDKTTQKSCVGSHLRRNTLPFVAVLPPQFHLPPLANQSDSHLQVPNQVSLSKSRSMAFLPRPPNSSAPSSSSAASRRPALLPPLPLAFSVTSLVVPPASCRSERSGRSRRRHSAQLDQNRK